MVNILPRALTQPRASGFIRGKSLAHSGQKTSAQSPVIKTAETSLPRHKSLAAYPQSRGHVRPSPPSLDQPALTRLI